MVKFPWSYTTLPIKSTLMFANEIAEYSVHTPTWISGEAELSTVLLPLFVGFGLSQVILGLLLLSRNPSKSIQQKFYGAVLISLLAYFIAPFTVETPYHIIVVTIMTALPGFFWLFCSSIFDDYFTLKRWQLLLVASTVVLPFFDLLARQLGYSPSAPLTLLLVDIPTLIELLLVGLALVAIARHWRVDLVQSRRDLRLWFCGVNGVYLFILLMLREVFYPYFSWLDYGQYASAGVIILITNMIFLRMTSGLLVENKQVNLRYLPKTVPIENQLTSSDLKEDEQGNSNTAPIESETVLQPTSSPWIIQNEGVTVPAKTLEQIRCALEEDCVYRDMDITIGLLAYRLEIPEYKLRTVINSGLGYRNFNDFLNSYRIKEVAKRLQSPEDEKNSVLTIALDAGFRSLSSFNKIFKTTYQITPTAYRKKHSE